MRLRLPAIRLQLSTLYPRISQPFSKATIALVLLVAVPSAYAVDVRSGQASASPQTPPSAVLSDPKTAKDFNQRGTSKVQKGDVDGAIADFSQAVQLKRDYAMAYYNRGTVYASTGNVRAALADYTQVIALKPNSGAARYSRGSLRANTGDRAGAIADLQQAAALFKQQKMVEMQQKSLKRLQQLQQP